MGELTGFTTLDVYKFIVKWAMEHKGNTPSQRQIAAAIGVAGSTVHYHTQTLISQGLLERLDGELCVVRAQFDTEPDVFDTSMA